MCQCASHAVPWSHIGILMRNLAEEPRSTAGLLFFSPCPSGTILLTQYSMAWDWRVSRTGPMFFYWPKLRYPYFRFLLFFPFSSSYWYCRLVLCGWGLRTDRVYNTLSALHCRPLIIIIIIIIIIMVPSFYVFPLSKTQPQFHR